MRIFASIILQLILFISAPFAVPQTAVPSTKVTGRYASIIIDMESEEVIHARQIDTPRYPASLTKLMTLYLTFEALDRGQLKLDQALPVSAFAAAQPPSKLGLRNGSKILVRDAINALIISSANDVAVVIAEAISGSESRFANLMTRRARDLGMSRTTFQNAHGLPNTGHISTARDMAKLGRAIMRDHRTYYPLFAQKEFTYRGQTRKSTNALLSVEGVDGLKTGYTYASGYNLIISAARNGERIIAVVLGGASGNSRNQHMRDLIERGFDVIQSRPKPATRQVIVKRDPVFQQHAPQKAVNTSILNLRGSNGQTQTIIHGHSTLTRPKKSEWSLYLGDFPTPAAAQLHLNTLTRHTPALKNHQHIVTSQPHFQARLTGLTRSDAHDLCQALKAEKQICMMVQHTG